MVRAVHTPKATAELGGAVDRGWLSLIAEEAKRLFGRRDPTVREAARTMGKAAAAKRERDNRTIEEIKRDKHAQLRAERDAGLVGGFPAQANRELAR